MGAAAILIAAASVRCLGSPDRLEEKSMTRVLARVGLKVRPFELFAILAESGGLRSTMAKSEEAPKADGAKDAKKKGDLDVEVRPLRAWHCMITCQKPLEINAAAWGPPTQAAERSGRLPTSPSVAALPRGLALSRARRSAPGWARPPGARRHLPTAVPTARRRSELCVAPSPVQPGLLAEEELSEEDQKLKDDLELMVTRVGDADGGVQKLAIESLGNEIRWGALPCASNRL